MSDVIRITGISRSCSIQDCTEQSECSVEIRFTMRVGEGYISLCRSHLQALRSKIDALSVLVQTGIDTKEE